jgi:site-specific recombinase XerD
MCDRRSAGITRHKTRKALDPILDYLRGLNVVPPFEAAVADGPASAVLDRYRRFLRVERSLVADTGDRYVDCLHPFLERRVSADGLDLELGNLTPADVTAFVVARCPHQNSGVAKLTITALRSFLGFLHLDGITERSLVAAVPSVARRRLAGLPKGLEPDQVRRLLASCDAHTPVGCRDLAILTLLVRLGLRRGEVAGLRLDDIDWRAGTIIVRGKASRIERMPLPPDVGRRLADYLAQARPANAKGRTVFVRCIAPHHQLGACRVSSIVADAARRADLGRIHSHRLRHTAAMQMLRAGISLPEIGQLLRHSRVETTAIYAKVDRDSLRLIARPWPGDVQ